MSKFFALSNSQEFVNKLTDKPGKIQTKIFSDGEIKVEILESVREKKVIIVGSLTSSNDIMELLMAGHAAKGASAKEVIALIPYLPYMRQDRKDVPRTAIGAKVIAKMIGAGGFSQVLTMDLHANQIEGFFDIPVTHISGRSIFVPYIKNNYDLNDVMIVSPDVGGAKRAKKFASDLNVPLAIINKEREMANEVSSMELIGDVRGKKVILVDDMVDTGGSLVKAVETLLENGATEVMACITHGVLSGPAISRIRESKLTKLYITDSIQKDSEILLSLTYNKIETISCSDIFKKSIQAIKQKKSVNKILNEL
jgi:ribose-phosphate pyrophosphokinase